MVNINRFIEHTILRPDLTGNDIDKLVAEAMEYEFVGICVPPFWIKKASREVGKENIQVVAPIGFPFGYNMTESKLDEIKRAMNNGADELDIVMNISAFKSNMEWAKIELSKCAEYIHENDGFMKVIIETAYLSEDEIIKACKMCKDAGTDFVKTSTGYASGGAKVEHIRLIRANLPERVGVKASGGIKDLETALSMIEAGADRLGMSAGVQVMLDADK